MRESPFMSKRFCARLISFKNLAWPSSRARAFFSLFHGLERTCSLMPSSAHISLHPELYEYIKVMNFTPSSVSSRWYPLGGTFTLRTRTRARTMPSSPLIFLVISSGVWSFRPSTGSGASCLGFFGFFFSVSISGIFFISELLDDLLLPVREHDPLFFPHPLYLRVPLGD